MAPTQIGDVRIERQGNQRWLVTPLTPEQLWPRLQAFIDADPARKAKYGTVLADLAALQEAGKAHREHDDAVNEIMRASALLGAALKYTESSTYALYLMSDTIWTWEFSHRGRPEWDRRLDRFAQHLVKVARTSDHTSPASKGIPASAAKTATTANKPRASAAAVFGSSADAGRSPRRTPKNAASITRAVVIAPRSGSPSRKWSSAAADPTCT